MKKLIALATLVMAGVLALVLGPALPGAAGNAGDGGTTQPRLEGLRVGCAHLSIGPNGRVRVTVVGVSETGWPLRTTARITCGRSTKRGTGSIVITKWSDIHKVTLPGVLKPGMRYYYDITLTGNGHVLRLPAGGRYSFVAPPGPTTWGASLAVFGDCRPWTERIHHLVSEEWPPVATALARTRPWLCLGAGDYIFAQASRTNAHHEPAVPDTRHRLDLRYEAFFGVADRIGSQAPLMLAPGNHEELGSADIPALSAWKYWLDFPAPDDSNMRYYSFDWGTRVHVAIIDPPEWSAFGFAGDGKAGNSRQAAWLIHDLKQNRKPWTIVLMHVPMFDPQPGAYWSGHKVYEGYPVDPAERDRLAAFLHEQGVDIVFQGHMSHYQRHMHNGMPYVIQGGGGAQLDAVYRDKFDAAAYSWWGFSTLRFKDKFGHAILTSYKVYPTPNVAAPLVTIGDRLVLKNNPRH